MNDGVKITQPVNTTDIGTVLQTSSRNVGFLCGNLHGNTNMWAKYKPVKQPFLDHREGYWKASDGKCGISIDVYTSIGTPSSGFMKDLIDGNTTWVYNPPKGGETQPFRMMDFDKYNHNAKNPVGDISNNTFYVLENGELTIMYDKIIIEDDNLQPSDIVIDGTQLTEWYLGIILIKSGTSQYIVATSSEKMGSSDYSIHLTNMTSKVGEYTAYPFLSNVFISQDGSIPTGKFTSFPHAADKIFIKDSDTIRYIFPNALWNNTHTQITVFGTCMNNAPGSFTFKNITAYIVRTDSADDNPATGTTIATKSLGNKTVNGNSQSDTSSVVIPISSYNERYTYWCGISADDVEITYNMTEDDSSED